MSIDSKPLGSAPPRHVCFVVEALGAGGAERVISLLASRWAEAGWQVAICSFDGPMDRVYYPLHHRVRLIRLGVARRPGLMSMLTMIRKMLALRRALTRERPEVVLSFLTKINVLTLAATIGTGLKVIACERNNIARQKAHPFWKLASSLLLRRAHALIAQTRRALDHLPASVQGRTRVIPNPIEPPPGIPAHYDAADDLRMVAVGRLTWQKGFDLLVEAFNRVAPRHPGWRLDIWGEGPDRRMLEALIRESPCADRISLPGVSGIHGGWAEGTSVFVLSSRYEGFPNALGEAMAAGLPVIAFDCPFGPRELIRNGLDGILIESENVQALARAMDSLMGAPRLRRALGENAAHSVRRLAPDRIAGQWELVVHSLAGRPARRTEAEAAGERKAAALLP